MYQRGEQRKLSRVDPELAGIFGTADGRRLEQWLNRSAEWVMQHGFPLVKVGEDEAGPWWEIVTKGGEAQWCLAPTQVRAHMGGAYGVCDKRAGWGTAHEGAGPCKRHDKLVDDVAAGGDGHRGRIGAWVMAHGFARALDVTPWEALLTAVKIAAGRVAYIEAKLGEAYSDEQLEGGGELAWWVKQAELWHDRMAKVAKMAIDAGVAERMVRQIELEAELMLKAATRTFDELGLDEVQRERALGTMSRHLLELEAAEVVNTLEVLD